MSFEKGIDPSILSEKLKSDSTILKNTPVLIIICGATATGKSGLAIALAQRLNSVIISADSRQVYREFNIGTAKPSVQEQNLIPHSLIDVCDPTETLTVADFQEMARAVIEKNSAVPVLLVGGTGLYIKSIVRGMKIPRVAPNERLRSQLEALGQRQCYEMLQQVDSVAAERIHPNDQVRSLRALEVFYVTGRPISEQQGEDPPNYHVIQIGLESQRLEQRIAQRTRQMIEMGLDTEVKTLCEKYGESLPLLDTLGYREMRQYLRGEISLDEAEQLTILHTRQFAKRQRTWFRADSSIEWFDSDAPDLLEQVWSRLRQWFDEIG